MLLNAGGINSKLWESAKVIDVFRATAEWLANKLVNVGLKILAQTIASGSPKEYF